uniref:Putative secreted peptide n=1 Tax=Anopheles braziliensis TaxID=58242 RepID=A0A2M3ZU65_9DIPT
MEAALFSFLCYHSCHSAYQVVPTGGVEKGIDKGENRQTIIHRKKLGRWGTMYGVQNKTTCMFVEDSGGERQIIIIFKKKKNITKILPLQYHGTCTANTVREDNERQRMRVVFGQK